jgi:benzil reductase ((S)-benzoin forming)
LPFTTCARERRKCGGEKAFPRPQQHCRSTYRALAEVQLAVAGEPEAAVGLAARHDKRVRPGAKVVLGEAVDALDADGLQRQAEGAARAARPRAAARGTVLRHWGERTRRGGAGNGKWGKERSGAFPSEMSSLAIVTGGGTGIGAALALSLARAGVRVIVAGRRPEPLLALAASASSILPCPADVSTEEGRAAIAQAATSALASMASGSKVDFLVQNAGCIGPIGPVASLPSPATAFEETLRTNVVGPMALYAALRPLLGRGSRVLHISSGAANGPVAGWGPYCASKAAFSMTYRVLREEEAGKGDGVLVASARPGVVDTHMQAEIRAGDFPAKARFLQLAERRHAAATAAAEASSASAAAAGAPPPTDALDDAANVGTFLRWLLMETGDGEFGTSEEWDIRDKSHQGRWVGKGTA